MTVCGKILEDTIRVTVDRVNDSSASTGLFEMIYEKEIDCLIVEETPVVTTETSIEATLLPTENVVDDKVEEKTALKTNDETFLFEQSIQTYNDKIIEVSC